MNKKPFRFDWTLLCMVIVLFVGIVLMQDLIGSTILRGSFWNSYSLQAMSWREGRTWVEYNPALELAVYDGHYYISFPPFPSVFMLPFTFIWGSNTPDNFIIAAVCIATAVLVYRMMKKRGINEYLAAFIGIFYVFGSNMAQMSLDGGVWYMAQSLNVLLCTLAVWCLINKHRGWSYALLAMAVGCRPFSLLYFPVFFLIYLFEDLRNDDDKSFIHCALKQWKCLIVPAAIGIAYMTYNYVRFDNFFEFGHNYLPEFTSSPEGQFSLTYLMENLKNLLIKPLQFTDNLNLDFDKTGLWYNGFMFYIANPIFLILIIKEIRNAIKERICVERIIILVAMIANILLLCYHKTLGGWQFGARYTVDFMALALLCLMIEKREKPYANMRIAPIAYVGWQPAPYEIGIAVFGIMFNIYGAVKLWQSMFLR